MQTKSIAGLLATTTLLVTNACGGSDSSRQSESPASAVSTANGAEFVAVVPRSSGSGVKAAVCPENILNSQSGRQYIQLRSDVRREAAAPGDSLRLTLAKASYIRNAYQPGDPTANDTLNIDCTTMRQIQGD